MANSHLLLGRLRDLEAECIRLSAADLPTELASARTVYEERLRHLERSHSRSWFGDHSTTYYGKFEPPPGGRSFDVEWGFIPGFSGSHNPGWRVYSRDEVQEFIFRDIGEDIFYAFHALADELTQKFSTVRDQTLDVLDALIPSCNLTSLQRYRDKIESDLTPYRVTDSLNSEANSSPNMTRDSEKAAKGRAAPTQVQYLATIQSVEVTKRRSGQMAGVLRNVIEAATLYEPEGVTPTPSNAVFIGHGRSEVWRALKDFISDG